VWQSDFQYYAAFELADGGRISDVRLDVDWIPALRWAEFEQDIVNDCAAEDRTVHPVIEPVWSSQSNRPYIGGITIRRSEENENSVDFPLTYFSGAVLDATSQLITSGALVAGQHFDYRVFALSDAQGSQPPGPEINVVAVEAAPAIERAEIAPFMAAVEAYAGNGVTPSSVSSQPAASVMPIFVPQQTFDEATELAQRTGDIETGGILVGNLCRTSDGTLFCKVTAQIPAEHTTATRQSLRFTPETWANVDAAIRLRGLGEVSVGWWHSHPFFCSKCSPEQRVLCPFSSPAFSAADRDLHREVFQKSWSIALLLSFLGGERPSYDVYAWNQGQIEAVNYFTLPATGGISGENT